MIRITIAGKTILILEPGNLEAVKQGHPIIITPDLIVGYTPDIDRFEREIVATGLMNISDRLEKVKRLDSMILESLKWPVVVRETVWSKE